MATKNERQTVVLGPEADEEEERRAAEDWAVIERLKARNANADPDKVLADVTAAVEEVRQEMYAERHAPRRR